LVYVISWDNAIDKKVKSSDDKDLGKVQSITRDYIQVKEGIVDKNYLQGYDGDHLWVSLTKDEVKSRFEGEKDPPISTFETAEYLERKTSVTKQYPDFETNIPAYGGTSAEGAAAATITDSLAMSWDKIIDKKVKSNDNEDMGKVESVAANYVEVKEGALHRKRYFVPKYYLEGFDGENLRASLTKDEIKDRYERDSPPTD
jgi:hypothetical protein